MNQCFPAQGITAEILSEIENNIGTKSFWKDWSEEPGRSKIRF